MTGKTKVVRISTIHNGIVTWVELYKINTESPKAINKDLWESLIRHINPVKVSGKAPPQSPATKNDKLIEMLVLLKKYGITFRISHDLKSFDVDPVYFANKDWDNFVQKIS